MTHGSKADLPAGPGTSPNLYGCQLSVRSLYVCFRDPLGEWKSLGNPCTGGSDLENAFTFFSQPNFVMAMPDHPGTFVFMADQWDPEDLSASRSGSDYISACMHTNPHIEV